MNPDFQITQLVFLGKFRDKIHVNNHLGNTSHQQIKPKHNNNLGSISTHNSIINYNDCDKIIHWIKMKFKTLV